MFGPSSLLAFAVARLWHRAGGAAWRETLEQALAPVSIGVTIASGIALARSTEHDWATYADHRRHHAAAGAHPAAPAGGDGGGACCWLADRALAAAAVTVAALSSAAAGVDGCRS